MPPPTAASSLPSEDGLMMGGFRRPKEVDCRRESADPGRSPEDGASVQQGMSAAPPPGSSTIANSKRKREHSTPCATRSAASEGTTDELASGDHDDPVNAARLQIAFGEPNKPSLARHVCSRIRPDDTCSAAIFATITQGQGTSSLNSKRRVHHVLSIPLTSGA